MIKIRYSDPNELSPGLHAAATSHGRATTVYLLSGLTAAERRAALRRLRLSARMGYCPRLPAAQLLLALCTDRIRTGAAQAGAVFRSHPAGSTVPVMVVSAGAVAFLLLSTVSIRVLQPPRSEGQLPPSFPVPSVSAMAAPAPGSAPYRSSGGSDRRGSDVGPLIPSRTKSGDPSVFTSPGISGFGTGSGSLTAATGPGGSGTTGSGSNGADPGSAGPSGGGASGGGTGGGGTGGTSGTGSGTGSGSGTGTGTSGSGTGTGAGTGTSGSGGGGTSTPAPGSGATSPAPPASSPAAPPTSPAAPPTSGSGASQPCLDLGPLGICLNV